jgi:hypothetical protein
MIKVIIKEVFNGKNLPTAQTAAEKSPKPMKSEKNHFSFSGMGRTLSNPYCGITKKSIIAAMTKAPAEPSRRNAATKTAATAKKAVFLTEK